MTSYLIAMEADDVPDLPGYGPDCTVGEVVREVQFLQEVQHSL